eukprot:gene26644-biopygen4341
MPGQILEGGAGGGKAYQEFGFSYQESQKCPYQESDRAYQEFDLCLSGQTVLLNMKKVGGGCKKLVDSDSSDEETQKVCHGRPILVGLPVLVASL